MPEPEAGPLTFAPRCGVGLKNTPPLSTYSEEAAFATRFALQITRKRYLESSFTFSTIPGKYRCYFWTPRVTAGRRAWEKVHPEYDRTSIGRATTGTTYIAIVQNLVWLKQHITTD